MTSAIEVLDEGSPTATVRVVGPFDLASADDVVSAGRRCLADEGTRTLVVDLSAVDFLDSSGVSALVQLRNGAERTGATVQVRGAGPQARRVIQISGLSEAFGLEGTS